MPKFYGQNKKRKDPRYFMNESESKTPDGMIDHYKNNPEVWKQMARNDYLDMAAGGDGGSGVGRRLDSDSIRRELYPDWDDSMFQQVIDAMEGSKEPMTPPWEEPGLARKAAMGRAQDLAQQGMAANDPSSLSTEELQARIKALQAELSNR